MADTADLQQDIQRALKGLYFLDSAEIRKILDEIKDLPVDGLQEVAKQLDAAKQKQDDVLRKLAAQNPHLPTDLNRMLTSAMADLSQQTRVTEAIEAEHILDDI